MVPTAGKEIVKGVADALPGLKPAIDSALAGDGGIVVSVTDTLDRAAKVSLSRLTSAPASPTVPVLSMANPPVQVTPLVQGPASGPPYHELTVTPTDVTPGTSGEVPTGGRDYSKP